MIQHQEQVQKNRGCIGVEGEYGAQIELFLRLIRVRLLFRIQSIFLYFTFCTKSLKQTIPNHQVIL